MNRKGFLILALVAVGIIFPSCEGGKDECVEQFKEEGLTESEAVDKCDEELMETVEAVR